MFVSAFIPFSYPLFNPLLYFSWVKTNLPSNSLSLFLEFGFFLFGSRYMSRCDIGIKIFEFSYFSFLFKKFLFKLFFLSINIWLLIQTLFHLLYNEFRAVWRKHILLSILVKN